MTKDIAKSVESAKNYKPWEAEYIGYNLKMAEERREGYKEGREEAIVELYCNGEISEETALKKTNRTKEELKRLAKKHRK